MAFTAIAKVPRRCAAYLEFSDTSHFLAWAALCGILAAFSIFHTKYIDWAGPFCRDGALPGECFYFIRRTPALVGILFHLVFVLPAALLACIQFVPRIRHRAIGIHRTCGRAALLLGLAGGLGSLPTIRYAFGGQLAGQAVAYLNLLIFTVSQLKAYWHIKHHQVEQHQAWMIRSWTYVSLE